MNLFQKILKSFKNLKIKLFKKNQYNLKNNIIMSETKEDILKFQWKKGDDFGKVVEVKSEDDSFYYFTDGSQIFKEVASEFLEMVENNNLPFPGADNITINKVSAKSNNKPQEVTGNLTQSSTHTSELHGLIEKLSKKHMVLFEPKLNLNAIDPNVFKMLVENADESPEDLVKTITEVAMSQIEIDKLRKYLQEEITNFLNNYYNE